MVGRQIQKLILILAATTIAAGAVEYKRERYDVITERSPFGEDPLLAQQEAEQKKEDAAALAASRKLEQQMRLCYLLETDSGDLRAGFQNLKAAAGEAGSFMLRLGENFQGMKLTDIDLTNNSATISMNGNPVTFELSKPKATAVAKKAATTTPRRLGGGFRRQPQQPTKPAEPTLTPEEQAAKRKEVRENLQQYQMEVIRAGMPPLPIPLTEEMDNQLVKEGVLPPPGAE